jgi:exodeoxyribonuclease VII small subunit
MNDQPASYEALYERLQDIVARLEAGDLPLEDSLALYEEGVRVASACQRLLDVATLRIEQLQARAGEMED